MIRSYREYDIAFSSVFTAENTQSPFRGKSPYPSLDTFNITQVCVLTLLNNLKPNKAQGSLHPKLLKILCHEITPILTQIFRLSLETGIVPTDWREGNVVPLFKKGDKHKPSNYRPVSLTSICSKIMEHIVVYNIRQHLDRNDILADEQHGFRSKRSRKSQLLTFTQICLRVYPEEARWMA